ncbi:unnamed protein product, partial [Mesorhabditis belari]|uniref:Uncharacterized protein n=1 Tax=Mesorhabditis belari TaxID=2138241 RepID=A0AAF3FLD7_9BILA
MVINYFNKEWIVVTKPGSDGEFLRGLFHDCVNSSKFEHGIKCSPWGETPDFEPIFSKPKEPCFFNYTIAWFSVLLLIWMSLWVIISITYCCNWRRCTVWNKAHGKKLYFGAIGGIVSFLIFGFMMLIPRLTAEYFEETEIPVKYEYSLGSGFFRFFFGGLFCYLLGLLIFFYDKIEEFLAKRKGHQQIPLQERTIQA